MVNKVSYITNQTYISGAIREYDIGKANISVLRSLGRISEEMYTDFYNMDKLEREIKFGLMLRDHKEYSKWLKDGLIHYKDLFYKANGISDNNIVSIHNDSVFLLNIVPNVTTFDRVQFKFKGDYIAFYNIFRMELYYGFNMITKEEKLEVKGINDQLLLKHNDYFIDFLKALFLERETAGIASAIELIQNFSTMYLNRELDVGYYREFNNMSNFKFNQRYMSDYCTEEQKQYIDISYNYNILRELFSIYSSQYFKSF